jgi:hypothetical protein
MSTIGAAAATGPAAAAMGATGGTMGGASGGTIGGTTGGASGGTIGGGATGTTGTGPGRAIGMPDMSASGAAHGAAAGAAAKLADDALYSHPPVTQAAAAAFALSPRATPNKPVPATTTPMLNRSKTAIAVDSFVRGPDIPSGATGKLAAPLSRFDDRVNYQQPNVNPAPRRTALFPNGDSPDAICTSRANRCP